MAARHFRIALRPLVALLLTAAALGIVACDSHQNVNAGNLVTVNGFVFQSRTQRVGVPGVTVLIEKSEDSGTPAVIPDIFVTTDRNGRYEARFNLSYPDGGGPFDITPQYVEESMRILMVAPEGGMQDLGAGFTFQTGKTYRIWDVFLEDFGALEQN